MLNHRILISVSTLALALASTAARADVTGDTFSEGYYFPDAGTQYCSSSNFVAGVTSGTDCTLEFTYSIQNNKLILTYIVNNTWTGGVGFNGPEFTDLSASLAGVTPTLDPASTQPTANETVLGVSGSTLYVDWQGESENVGDTVIVDLGPSSATPEPSSLTLLGTGVLGVFGMLRKRFS